MNATIKIALVATAGGALGQLGAVPVIVLLRDRGHESALGEYLIGAAFAMLGTYVALRLAM